MNTALNDTLFKYTSVLSMVIKPLIYVISITLISSLSIEHELLLPLGQLTVSNCLWSIGIHLAILALCVILFSQVIRRELSTMIACLKNDRFFRLWLLCIGILFLLVNCIKGFTFVNLYSAVYYLFVISFCEEVVFRGYLFNELSMKFSFAASIVISGVLFGSAHGIFAYFIYGQSAISILSYFGGGILAAIVFVFVYRKTKSLAPPILIHALLDCMPGL